MALVITTATDEVLGEVISVSGEVDVSCAAERREAIDATLESAATRVTIDIAKVPYIDSTGIGVLVGAAHRAEEAGKELKVQNPQASVMRPLDLLGVAGELGINAE